MSRLRSNLRRLPPLAALVSFCGVLWLAGTLGSPQRAEAYHAPAEASPVLLPRAFAPLLPPKQAKQRATHASPFAVDTCERLRIDGEGRLRRVRKPTTPKQRARARKELRTWLRSTAAAFEPREADELARALSAWALRESTYTPSAVHVLSPDLDAAKRSSPDLEHPHARATIELEAPDGTTVEAGAWGVSRGLFGFAPALWLHRWGAVEPWALCDERVAVSVAVWALRAHLSECTRRGYPATWRTLNRRFSSGHCEERGEKYERAWTKRARGQGLDPDAPVRFSGKAWPEDATARRELLASLRRDAGAV